MLLTFDNSIDCKVCLQWTDNFPLLLKELDALHLTAFRYQRRKLFQRLNPLFQAAEHLTVLCGNGVDGIYPDQAELYGICIQIAVGSLEIDVRDIDSDVVARLAFPAGSQLFHVIHHSE